MVVDAGGNGRISNFDASGNVVSQFNSVGLNVYNTDASAVAGVTRGGGTGRIAVWREGKTVCGRRRCRRKWDRFDLRQRQGSR